MRPRSIVAPQWWDYTTLDREILDEAARLSVDELLGLSRDGFTVKSYDTIEDFYLAEALEYITAWRHATEDAPTGLCGPIGPTEQLPLVARLVNELNIDLRHAHFWAMDEWVLDGQIVGEDFPLSFKRTNMELCFNRIRPELRMPDENLHFPGADLPAFSASFDAARCLVMQGGQGDVKHWAFNDPLRREGDYSDAPPSPREYRKLATRIVDLHPMTITQNARTSGGGVISNVPGPRTPLYWNGARLAGMYPVSIVTHGLAVNITVTSYVDSLDFGITACRRSVPAVQRLIDYLEEGLAELE